MWKHDVSRHPYKPKLHNILHCRQRRIEPRPLITNIHRNFREVRAYVVSEICQWTDNAHIQTYRHALRNTLHTTRGRNVELKHIRIVCLVLFLLHFCQFAQKLRMNLSSAVYATYSIEAVCYCNFHVLCILLPVITRLLGAYDNKQFVFASDELLLTSWNCYRFNLLRERVLFPPTLPTFPLVFLLLTFIHFLIILSLCYLCPTTASSPHFAFSPLPTWNTAYC